MNKLTKLSIKKFRNVAPTTLEFSPGLNVLLGRNAAGKTTLLRLLSVAAGILDETLEDDELEVSYHVSSGAIEVEQTINRTRFEEPALNLETSRQMREEFPRLQRTDSFRIKQDDTVIKADVLPNKVVLDIRGEQSHIERRITGEPLPSLVIALMQNKKDSIPRELTAAIMAAHIRSAGRMDESLERFEDLFRFDLRREERTSHFSGTFGVVFGSMFGMLSESIPEGTSTTYSPPFLNRAAQVLGYDSASARFDVERLGQEPNKQIVRFSNLRFFFKRLGEEISHNLLSYGQKRLLAFYSLVDTSPDVVIADELVNGLHHEWIQACLSEVGERQAFLTSQNPLLLDFLRFNDVEHVRRTFILCERIVGESGAQLVWRNPTMDEAESFFSAYETGIQRISDILLTKGLW